MEYVIFGLCFLLGRREHVSITEKGLDVGMKYKKALPFGKKRKKCG